MFRAVVSLLVIWVVVLTSAGAPATSTYSGMCNASAAVALDDRHFAMADDEENIIRIYHADRPGAPVGQFDAAPHLNLARKSPETDIEGAARIGDVVFWITSHSRNKNAKSRPNRLRLFATQVVRTGGVPQLKPLGSPCTVLLDALLADERLLPFQLKAAAGRAPKERDGLNIEGLSATPEGYLLLGFRNPVPGGKALLVPLRNPLELVQGRPPQLGDPIRLDLGGLGVRSMDWWAGRYWIVAGHHDGQARSQLLVWDGQQVRRVEADFSDFNPEALAFYPGRDVVQCFSDDGKRRLGATDCEELRDPVQRRFRSLWVRMK